MKNLLKFFLFVFLFLSFFVCATEKVEINSATIEELKTLTGIGDVKAQTIIDNRPFSSIDDLLKVNGIGEKTLEKIKEQGLAYVGEKSKTQNIKSETNLISQNLNNQNVTEAKKVYPSGILINEIMPSPEGSDETEEWIEIYNSNNFNVDLDSWRIKDTNGTPTIYTFPQNSIITAFGFILLKRPESKITLNNDSDGLNLFNPDGDVVDSVEFGKAIKNYSYVRTSSNPNTQTAWQWSLVSTPKAINFIASKNSLSKTEKSVNNNGVELGLANISQATNINQNAKNTNPWFLFFMALIITIILSFTVLFIKLKFQKNVRT